MTINKNLELTEYLISECLSKPLIQMYFTDMLSLYMKYKDNIYFILHTTVIPLDMRSKDLKYYINQKEVFYLNGNGLSKLIQGRINEEFI